MPADSPVKLTPHPLDTGVPSMRGRTENRAIRHPLPLAVGIPRSGPGTEHGFVGEDRRSAGRTRWGLGGARRGPSTDSRGLVPGACLARYAPS